MKTFTLFWRDGKRQVVTGETIAKAMTKAGYGAGAVAALDFYAEGDNSEWVYDVALKDWVRPPATDQLAV